jgi:hypothetical protein
MRAITMAKTASGTARSPSSFIGMAGIHEGSFGAVKVFVGVIVLT